MRTNTSSRPSYFRVDESFPSPEQFRFLLRTLHGDLLAVLLALLSHCTPDGEHFLISLQTLEIESGLGHDRLTAALLMLHEARFIAINGSSIDGVLKVSFTNRVLVKRRGYTISRKLLSQGHWANLTKNQRGVLWAIAFFMRGRDVDSNYDDEPDVMRWAEDIGAVAYKQFTHASGSIDERAFFPRAGPLTMSQISHLTGIALPNVPAIVRRLEELQLIAVYRNQRPFWYHLPAPIWF